MGVLEKILYGGLVVLGFAALSIVFSVRASAWCGSERIPRIFCIMSRIVPEKLAITTPDKIEVTSNTFESPEYSIARGNGAQALVDGSLSNMAAPGNDKLDYTLDFSGPYDVRETRIHWRNFGISNNYVNDWSLEATSNGKEWRMIAKGGFPNEEITLIEDPFSAVAVRLKAKSAKDWIGVYEIEFDREIAR